MDKTTTKDPSVKIWNDKAQDNTVMASAISPHDGRSQSYHVSSARQSDYAGLDTGTTAKTIVSSPAVQVLLSRWLGENASVVLGMVVDGPPGLIPDM